MRSDEQIQMTQISFAEAMFEHIRRQLILAR